MAKNVSYEFLAGLFAQAKGMGKGKHHEVLSTTKTANPKYIYIPNSPTTNESNNYSAWNKVPFDPAWTVNGYLVRKDTLADSYTYTLSPNPFDDTQETEFQN